MIDKEEVQRFLNQFNSKMRVFGIIYRDDRDELNRLGEMWVFGKDVKEREIYIKIMLGCADSQTICISFHIAEYPLSYPFKTVEE